MPADFYSLGEHAERLIYTSPEATVLDDHGPYKIHAHTSELKVYAWARCKRPEKPLLNRNDILDWLQDAVLEAYEEYVDPENGYDVPDEVRTATETLAEAIRITLPLWACHRAPEHDVTVDVQALLRKNDDGSPR